MNEAKKPARILVVMVTALDDRASRLRGPVFTGMTGSSLSKFQ